MTNEEIAEKIDKIKAKRNAIILAHNYQIAEVQDIADHVADSFELSRIAAEVDAEVIVFCGVHFMAESAAILAPHKTVLLPDPDAGCPLADMINVEQLKNFKIEHPNAAVVTYINSTAAVKAESDICVTSANATRVVDSLDEEEILFVPDGNLGRFVARHTSKKIIPWPGHCDTHHYLDEEDVIQARLDHPGAPVIVHPECRPPVVELADAALGTGAMIAYAHSSCAAEIIIGTEMGMLHRLSKECPDKKFHLLSEKLVCPTMKYTTLEKVLAALENNQFEITVPEETRKKAVLALQRMLEVS